MLDTSQLGEFIKSRFNRLAFRLETLDLYDVGSDGEDVERYLRGDPGPDPERKGPWLTRLRDDRAAGKLRQCVHVLRGPLSDYLRYECEWGYAFNVPAGQDVRILDLADRPRPAGLDIDHDFWLLDDEVVVRMHYDKGGRFLGGEVLSEDELPRYREARDAALAAAEPFHDYWQHHLEYHRSIRRAMASARDSHSRLAAQLRELRGAAGLSGIEAGRRTGISQSKISKIENKALRPAPDDVRALCKIYDAPADLTDWLVELSESLRTETIEPRRVTLSRGAPGMQQKIRKYEESATLLRSYQPNMVIGLLQTEAYARLVFGQSQTGTRLDRSVAERMRRQRVLKRKKEPRAVLIMTEGALRWHAGSPALMVEQLETIATLSRLPNVQVGIIPYTAPVAFFPLHGFHLYDADVAIVGTETGTATIVDPDDIARFESIFTKLERAAVTGEAARDVLARVTEDYRRLDSALVDA